jgi:hypothetical protein
MTHRDNGMNDSDTPFVQTGCSSDNQSDRGVIDLMSNFDTLTTQETEKLKESLRIHEKSLSLLGQ